MSYSEEIRAHEVTAECVERDCPCQASSGREPVNQSPASPRAAGTGLRFQESAKSLLVIIVIALSGCAHRQPHGPCTPEELKRKTCVEVRMPVNAL